MIKRSNLFVLSYFRSRGVSPLTPIKSKKKTEKIIIFCEFAKRALVESGIR